MYYIYMIAHMGWIGLGQNFRKKYGLDWIGSEIDWIGLGWIKKIGPMSNSVPYIVKLLLSLVCGEINLLIQ